MRVTSEGMRSVEGRGSLVKQQERRPVALTTRDRELFVHLAMARYLTAEQISKLVFSGKTDSIARRRLSRLVSGAHSYVRRLPFRTKAGGQSIAWCLKPLGYMAARTLFHGIPELPIHEPPGAEFLEHDIWLTDLYVALATAASRKKLAFDRWPFRWLASDSARLPWTEFDRERGSAVARLIAPDATVELMHARRRIFIEAETGSHTLGFRRDGAPGRNATKSKIERYTRFMLTADSSTGETFYARTFPDRWPAELLFVVPTAARRNAIAEYVASSPLTTGESVQLAIRAMTFDEAAPSLCRAAQLVSEAAVPPSAGPSHATVTLDEIRAFYDFYNDAVAAIAAVRQFAKERRPLPVDFPMPDYPSNHAVVKQLCARLGANVR